MNEAPRTRIIANSLTLALASAGDGPPVLLLHGWGASADLMWPLGERLAASGWRAVVPDLPGFGQSDVPSSAWSVFDYAALVRALLDQLGLARVDVVGHSFGGRLGLVLGADHAARVRKLVLIDSAGIRPPAPRGARLRLNAYKAARDGLAAVGLRGLAEQLRGWYGARYGSADYRSAGPLRETFVRVVNEDLLGHAARVQAPTLLLWGGADADTPLWMGRRLEQVIPDAGLHVFEGTGHYSYLERLPEAARIIDYFLRHD